MLVIFLLILLAGEKTQGIVVEENADKNIITACVTRILEKYFIEKDLTMVNIKTNSDDKLIKAIFHTHYSIALRDTSHKSSIQHLHYVILAANTDDFIQEFTGLLRDRTWNPNGKFLIVIKQLREENLVPVFRKLMNMHVVNVLVVNGSKSVETYAYNPYENYGCGKSFDRIISYGRCFFTSEVNLYPYKLVTGLRNCTFKALVGDTPPFTINPRGEKKKIVGLEQFAFDTIGEIEDFTVNYTYGDFGETWSTVDENNTARGVLARIQSNEIDTVFGSMWLSYTRGAAFDLLYGHLAFTDEFTFVVPRAGPVKRWRLVYKEFTMTVWLLILLSFVAYAVLMVTLIRGRDRLLIIFKMVDTLTLHGSPIRARFNVKLVFLMWVWFAYLINAHYQSSLVSLVTHPSKEYQVKDIEDLKAYNYQPCISHVVNEFMTIEGQLNFKQRNECVKVIKAAEYVSEHENVYTLIPRLYFDYSNYLFYDESGKYKVFLFDKAVSKITYAIYLYKGFPMLHKLYVATLRLRENGLMDAHFRILYNEQKKIHSSAIKTNKENPYHVFIPWWVLGFGVTISTFTLILEMLSTKKFKTMLKRVKHKVYFYVTHPTQIFSSP